MTKSQLNLSLILMSLLMVLLILYIYASNQIIYWSDLSIRPIEHENLYPETYLITYATGPDYVKKNQLFTAYSGLMQPFKNIIMYNEKHIDRNFYQKNKEILSLKTGAGYWLWKPYFILKTLETVPENAIVMYLDGGIMLTKDITELLKDVDKHQMVLVDYFYDEYGNVGTKSPRSVLEKTNCDTKECRKSPHILAAFGVFKNTPQVRKFVKYWLTLCEDPNLLVHPQSTKLGEHTEFVSFQQDETLLSIVNYKMNIGQKLIPHPEFAKLYGIHHRRKNNRPLLRELLTKQDKISWQGKFYKEVNKIFGYQA